MKTPSVKRQAAVARSHWNTVAAPLDASKSTPPISKHQGERHNGSIDLHCMNLEAATAADVAARSVHNLTFHDTQKISVIISFDIEFG